MRTHTVLIAPDGSETLLGYDGHTVSRKHATAYVSPEIATGAAIAHFGHSGREFWDCERDAARIARKKYQGWTYRTIPA